jgi:hypothetical protein
VPEVFIKGKSLYSANLNPENPLCPDPAPHSALADYQAQANKLFDHEARMKELLGRQAQLDAALDLDKNETQIAPPAEFCPRFERLRP